MIGDWDQSGPQPSTSREQDVALDQSTEDTSRPDSGATSLHTGEPGPWWADLGWDVVVVGGGNAGLVAALRANDLGARVLVVERAPRYLRGGNSRHTRNIRCVHDKDAYSTGHYRYAELWEDLCGVGDGPGNEEIASLTVRESEGMPAWMAAHGARWQAPLSGTLHLGRTNRFFLGGGKALINAYYREIDRRPGVAVVYDAKLDEFVFDGITCRGVIVSCAGRSYRVAANAIVCASGGFESNLEWLRLYWGAAADNYLIRGTPYNDGHVLALLYREGAAKAGDEKGFHAIAIDARSPKFDGGIATRLDTIPFGIVLNKNGARFYDEGEDLWPKRYATWGRHIAEQPDQLAYSFWDSKVAGLFLPPMYGVAAADNLADLADEAGLDPGAVERTVATYNAAVVPGGTFDATLLDDCRTEGLLPPKSHWAQPLDDPPYHMVAMRPGITFTYMGVGVNRDARVVREDGRGFENVFAAGEIMSGNVLSSGYLAGFGMTIGSVWGYRAGSEAARYGHD